MNIREQLLAEDPIFSFEFYPPKTTKTEQRFMQQARQLARLSPTFMSVTCGAGGSTKDKTTELTLHLHEELNVQTMPHFTCVGLSRSQLKDDILDFKAKGIKSVMALRGDPPMNAPEFTPHPDGLCYANELVAMISEIGGLEIGVAGYPEGHPETPSKLDDLYNLKRKVDAGADFIITQLFFDNREFFDFRERCELIGIDVPIIAGIMPVLSRRSVLRMCDMCGARIPAGLLRRLFDASDDDVARIGVDWATQQCENLLDEGVAGLHFYTLNKSAATCHIFRGIHNISCNCGQCDNHDSIL